MSKVYTSANADVTTQKFSEDHVEGLYIERLAVCADSGEPLVDEQGHAVVETCVNVGVTRGLFDLLLWQWALFGTILVTLVAGWDKGLLNLGLTLGFILILFLQKLVVKQLKSEGVSVEDVKEAFYTQ